MKTTAEVFEIQEGGFNGHIHKRSGRSKWENIVLKYATNWSQELLEWRDKYLQDKFTEGLRPQTSGSIIMYANDGGELRRFNFVNAWPVGWEGPTLQSQGSELAIETLEIAHEGIFVDGKPEPPPEPVEPPEPPERLDLPPVQFEYNSAQLTPQGEQVVAAAAEQINDMEITEMWIEGHTCTMGSFGYNAFLSGKRAASVVSQLKAEGTPNTQYYSQGFGWKYPVASNANEGGKSANRRTEFMTSSWADRGMDPDPVVPENKKFGAPWNHR